MQSAPTWRARARTLILKMVTRLHYRKYARRLHPALHNPKAVQEQTLLRILRSQAQTAFGKFHRFDQVHSVEDYRATLGVQDYESLRIWIERQNLSNNPEIVADEIKLFAVTSGTTGQPKFIPIHKPSMDAYSLMQKFYFAELVKKYPRILDGQIFAIVSPGVEGHRLDSGRPYGSASGHMYEHIPSLIRALYVLPKEVFRVEPADLRYLLIVRLALAAPNIRYITTANPSTISKLIQTAEESWEALTSDIEHGGFHRLSEVAPEIRSVIEPLLKASPQRSQELRKVRASHSGGLNLKDLWPETTVVGCWTGGSCSMFLNHWTNGLPPNAVVQDVGYISSEFRGTLAVLGSRAGLPTLLEHFWEFVERERWESGDPRYLGLHEIEHGKQYYVFITTDTGLYRYDINDIVQVDGFIEQTPKLLFVQKGKGVTNITGEKLSESQLIEAVRTAEDDLDLVSTFFIGIADEARARYQLCYEPRSSDVAHALKERTQLAEIIEARLSETNIEYNSKRQSGRLGPMEVIVLRPGTLDAFRSFSVSLGQREGQFKIVALQSSQDCRFDFSAHAVVDFRKPLSVVPLKDSASSFSAPVELDVTSSRTRPMG